MQIALTQRSNDRAKPAGSRSARCTPARACNPTLSSSWAISSSCCVDWLKFASGSGPLSRHSRLTAARANVILGTWVLSTKRQVLARRTKCFVRSTRRAQVSLRSRSSSSRAPASLANSLWRYASSA